jgi:hypothetical protein
MASERRHGGVGWRRALELAGALLSLGSSLLSTELSYSRPEPLPPVSDASPPRFDQKWLEAFYKECGREVTLAYTTLNQMKNWAMIVVAAAISGLSFGTAANNYPSVPMFVGTVVVYTFVLRFYVRAILCYINLGRWNRLQSDCVNLALAPPGSDRPALEAKLAASIETYYHQWRSVYSRTTQLVSNLKLGFALLLALPLFFMTWGAIALWSSGMVQGLASFAIGDTAVELNDFLKSGYFDNPAAHERKAAKAARQQLFPAPESGTIFVGLWVSVVVGSILVVNRDALILRISAFLEHWLQ